MNTSIEQAARARASAKAEENAREIESYYYGMDPRDLSLDEVDRHASICLMFLFEAAPYMQLKALRRLSGSVDSLADIVDLHLSAEEEIYRNQWVSPDEEAEGGGKARDWASSD
jgi:hypothetical protein